MVFTFGFHVKRQPNEGLIEFGDTKGKTNIQTFGSFNHEKCKIGRKARKYEKKVFFSHFNIILFDGNVCDIAKSGSKRD